MLFLSPVINFSVFLSLCLWSHKVHIVMLNSDKFFWVPAYDTTETTKCWDIVTVNTSGGEKPFFSDLFVLLMQSY